MDKKYFIVLNDIKNQIQESRNRAIISANEELIKSYFYIGKKLIENDEWGSKFIEKLSKDLKINFPNLKEMSATNLRYMKRFANEYTEEEIFQQGVGKLTWRSNIMLLEKVKTHQERLWYINKALENGWSSTVLDHQIGTRLIDRQGNNAEKTTNFLEKLDNNIGERVQEMFKDPYLFDFLSYQDGFVEKEIEDVLVTNITKLLLELGKGFAFLGRQYHIEVGDDDFYIDLLFYNVILKCYVVLELKTTKFIPEYAGKLNFYLSAVDSILKGESDNPTVGILLCRDKNKLTAEFALKDIDKPLGVAEYKYMQEIPEYLSNTMPTIEDIESRINNLEESRKE